MNQTPDDPRTQELRANLDAVAASLAEFKAALYGVNDEDLVTAFQPPLGTGENVIDHHRAAITPTIADDVANLFSQFRRHPVPREDPDLGRLESLARLRSARGNLVADLEATLESAASLGLTASDPSATVPSAIQFEKAGLAGMLGGLERRLKDVEETLKTIAPEGEEGGGRSVQQVGLVNFYVGSMSVELALARLETLARDLVDFASLARAIETMSELTRDFLASVDGMRRKITEGLRAASRNLRPVIGRVTRGLRALVHRVRKHQPADRQDLEKKQITSPVPVAELDEFNRRRDESLEEFHVLIKRGDWMLVAGNLGGARSDYEAALAIAERVTKEEPGNSEWERNLALSFNKLGDIEMSAGNLGAARDRFEGGLAIAERLAGQEPANTESQRDLSVSFNKLGDIEVSAGNLEAARERFEAGLAIRERLARQAPANAQWQRDLSVSFNKLGDIEVLAGNLEAARERFEAGLAIGERLGGQEPANTGWQRDLSVSFNKLGDVEVLAGDLGAARQRFEAGLAIAERLAGQEPANTQWQRDLSVSLERLGNVEVLAGDLGSARERFEAGLAIRERLARQEPANTEWQRDLSVSFHKLGDLEVSAGNLGAARERFEADLAIAERLARQEPANTEWQRDLVVSNVRIAQLILAEGRVDEALDRLDAAKSIITSLAELHPDHPGFAGDLRTVSEEIDRLRKPGGE